MVCECGHTTSVSDSDGSGATDIQELISCGQGESEHLIVLQNSVIRGCDGHCSTGDCPTEHYHLRHLRKITAGHCMYIELADHQYCNTN